MTIILHRAILIVSISASIPANLLAANNERFNLPENLYNNTTVPSQIMEPTNQDERIDNDLKTQLQSLMDNVYPQDNRPQPSIINIDLEQNIDQQNTSSTIQSMNTTAIISQFRRQSGLISRIKHVLKSQHHNQVANNERIHTLETQVHALQEENKRIQRQMNELKKPIKNVAKPKVLRQKPIKK